jgi:hypothetical protein
MKKVLSLLIVFFCFSIVYADNLAQILPVSEEWRYLVGQDIPAGMYYLLPIQDISPCSATLQYTIIHDYASREDESESRDYTQQPELFYPEQADHYITINDGDLLMMFATPKCNVLLIPKGEDATGGLSGLSYDGLIARKNQINLAIWKSQEWQEVTVPQGTWKVGEDIPAGHWTVKCTDKVTFSTISWGERLDENGQDISYFGKSSTSNSIYNPEHYENRDRYPVEYSFEVVDGDYIQINNGSVVFMPYVGKPSFGFK